MISEVNICNMALTRIGQNRIMSLTQTGTLAELCKLYYEPTLNELLSAYEWPFAISRSQLSASAEENLTVFDYRYQLPLNYLRVLTMLSSEDYSEITDDWEIEGDKLLSDVTPAYIKYIKMITNPTKLPQSFIEALYLRIASKIVVKITQDQSLMAALFQEYMAAMQAAMAYLGGNKKAERQPDDWWDD